jgi:hypothetical protein
VVSSFVTVPVGEVAHGNIETKPKSQISIQADIPQKLGDDEVEALVRSYFEDIPVMVGIARCESTFTHTLKDGSVIKGKVDSADTGVMQINLRYHEKRAISLGYDLHDIQGNLAYARLLYEERGTQPWNASASCWRNTLASL